MQTFLKAGGTAKHLNSKCLSLLRPARPNAGACSCRRARLVHQRRFAHTFKDEEEDPPLDPEIASLAPGFSAKEAALDEKTIESYKNSFAFKDATHSVEELWDPQHYKKRIIVHGYLGKRVDMAKNLSFAVLHSKDLFRSIQVLSKASEGDTESSEAHKELKRTEENSPVVIEGILQRKKDQKGVRDAEEEWKENQLPELDEDDLASLDDDETLSKERTPTTPTLEKKSQSLDKGKSPYRENKHKPFNSNKKNTGPNTLSANEIVLKSVQRLAQWPPELAKMKLSSFEAKDRHLQLRTNFDRRMALKYRSIVTRQLRNILQKYNFVEVETPLLFKSTPEGAREFIVPSREKGLAYALPQSPQQYKQLLMASGIPKYFQFAKCFRDEDNRADRQPEFTQLDLEMSFASGIDVQFFVTALMKKVFKALSLRFEMNPAITYEAAMARYGSDKPDLRFDMNISPCDELVPKKLRSMLRPPDGFPIGEEDIIYECMKLKVSDSPRETRQFVRDFMDKHNTELSKNPCGPPGLFVVDHSLPIKGFSAFGEASAERWFKSHSMQLRQGDLLIVQAGLPWTETGTAGSRPIGDLRLALYKAAEDAGLAPKRQGYQLIWIRNFPMFKQSSELEPGQGGLAGIAANHHPFTAPQNPKHFERMLRSPLRAKADHYDLVCNGVELGGGSRRIHDAKVQEYVFRHILKMPEEKIRQFDHLLNALRAGCPPHAGFALGLDRFVALLLAKDTIRDVIAFPKNAKGEDLLVKSPGPISGKVAETYHLLE